MLTWSAKIYLAILIIVGIIITIMSFISVMDTISIIKNLSNYIVILSVALIVFPTVAVPLMLQIISIAREKFEELPTRGFYRDFNIACLIVSIGAILEIIIIILFNIVKIIFIKKIFASFALSNLISYLFIFILIILLLQKIVIELEPSLSR